MKNYLFVIFFCLQTISCSAQGVKIDFEIKNLHNDWLFFSEVYGDRQFFIDSLQTDTAGKATFRRDSLLQQGVYILSDKKGRSIEILLGEDQQFVLKTDTTNFEGLPTYEGSDENATMVSFYKKIGEITEQINNARLQFDFANEEDKETLSEELHELQTEGLKYRNEMFAKNNNKFFVKLTKASIPVSLPDSLRQLQGHEGFTKKYGYMLEHYFDNIDFEDARLLHSAVFDARIEAYFNEVIHPAPDSVVRYGHMWVERLDPHPKFQKYFLQFLIGMQHRVNRIGLDKVFVETILKYADSPRMEFLSPEMRETMKKRAKRLERTMIGKVAANLLLQNEKGESYETNESDSKFTLLVFWSPDCGHCTTALPTLKPVYEKYKAQGVNFLAICTQQESKPWLDFIHENKLDWINLHDPDSTSQMHEKYNLYMTPSFYLLDQDHRIVLKDFDAGQVPMLFETLLEK